MDFEMKIDPVKALTDKIDGEYGSDSAEIFRMYVADFENRQQRIVEKVANDPSTIE